MKKWAKKEAKDAKDFNGKRQRGSGNQWNYPGDVKTNLFLIDTKTTANKSFSVTKQMWDKLCEEASLTDRIPVLSVEVQDLELITLSKTDFMLLLKKAKLLA